jgi:hypothetical protein
MPGLNDLHLQVPVSTTPLECLPRTLKSMRVGFVTSSISLLAHPPLPLFRPLHSPNHLFFLVHLHKSQFP